MYRGNIDRIIAALDEICSSTYAASVSKEMIVHLLEENMDHIDKHACEREYLVIDDRYTGTTPFNERIGG